MKKLLTLFLLAGTTGFSQQIDSLSLSYSIGYKATHTIDGKEVRGVYEKKQEIRYRKKRHSYQISSFVSVETFGEWKQPNLLRDSMKTPGAFMRRKLPGKTLDEFLESIVSIQKDSVFPYGMKDIPASFLKENSLTRKSDKNRIDSLVSSKLEVQIMSNVTGYFCIHFHYRGASYDLYKDSNNIDWRIYISGNEADEPFHLVHFAFNEFLLNELPKQFSGIKVVN